MSLDCDWHEDLTKRHETCHVLGCYKHLHHLRFSIGAEMHGWCTHWWQDMALSTVVLLHKTSNYFPIWNKNFGFLESWRGLPNCCICHTVCSIWRMNALNGIVCTSATDEPCLLTLLWIQSEPLSALSCLTHSICIIPTEVSCAILVKKKVRESLCVCVRVRVCV